VLTSNWSTCQSIKSTNGRTKFGHFLNYREEKIKFLNLRD
jgi:hypothetical protein